MSNFLYPQNKQEALSFGLDASQEIKQRQQKNKTLEKNGLETPIISPEMAGVGLVRTGQGIGQKLLGNIGGSKLINQGKGFTLGSIGGDMGAYGATQTIDAVTPQSFKEENPNLYTAINVAGGLAGGVKGGMTAEKKYLSKNANDLMNKALGKPTISLDDEIRQLANKTTLDEDIRALVAKNNPISNANLGHNLAGGSAGALESEFNQRDYNGDGVHDAKDNLYGAGVGIGGINVAKNVRPDLFKDEVKGAKTGMFVGAKDDELGAFSDIASKKTMREIDDSKAIVKPFEDGRISHRLSEVLDHPELYKQYPEMKDLWVSAQKGKGGSFDGKHIKTETTNADNLIVDEMYKKEDEILAKYERLADKDGNLTPELEAQAEKEISDMTEQLKSQFKGGRIADKSTLLHETQHAIQDKERWARGGSPKEFRDSTNEEYAKYKKELEYANGLYADLRDAEEWVKYRTGELKFDELSYPMMKEFTDGITVTEDDYYKAMKQKEASSHYYNLPLKDVQRMLSNTDTMFNRINKNKPLDARQKYEALWGEQQARATQERLNMTPEQRAKEDWTKTLERVEGKYNEPIIKYDDGVSMSASKVDDDFEDFKNSALNGNTDKPFNFGFVSDNAVAKIKQMTGLNLKGYSRVIDSNSIRHIKNRHPNDINELNKLSDIFENFDYAEKSLTKDINKGSNNVSIVLSKKYDDGTLKTVELRDFGNKTLKLKTFYKKG